MKVVDVKKISLKMIKVFVKIVRKIVKYVIIKILVNYVNNHFIFKIINVCSVLIIVKYVMIIKNV